MLYLRNTNLVQSLGKDIQRGVANICCTPTLESVTTASFTQLNVNVLFGTYLVNCKSCVGGYIQVSEDSGSTWTTINPGNCSPSNLVPMPSQSAYYRAFTSCSAVDQPFDPLVSDFSNEIFFVPNSRLNYRFTENGAEGEFKLIVTGSTILNTTTSDSGTFYQIPSASAVSASVGIISVPTTGSTSMSLWITGSNVSYYTSSCVYSSGSVFIGNYSAIPNLDYYVTASIDHRPENTCTASAYTELGYSVNSYDEASGIWYPLNSNGTYTPGTGISASISGSATKTNILSGDCRQNAIQFSGSLTLNIGTGSYSSVFLGIVTGSFSLSGVNTASPGNAPWNLSVAYQNTGSINAVGYTINDATTKNALVGMSIGGYFPSSQDTGIFVFVTGSQVAYNPPTVSGGPWNFGTTLTLSGVGIIRAFGYGNTGTTNSQAQYNCMFETTPSK